MNGFTEELSNSQDTKTLEKVTIGRGPPISSAVITYGTNACPGGLEWGLSHLVAEGERR